MDSPLDTTEVEQYYTLNDSIAIVMMVDVEMDLMNIYVSVKVWPPSMRDSGLSL